MYVDVDIGLCLLNKVLLLPYKWVLVEYRPLWTLMTNQTNECMHLEVCVVQSLHLDVVYFAVPSNPVFHQKVSNLSVRQNTSCVISNVILPGSCAL